MIEPTRYFPRAVQTVVEAWELTAETIDELAEQHGLELVKTWPGPTLALQHDEYGITVREELGGYLVRHADGALELLCQASMVARYTESAVADGYSFGESYAA